MLDISIVETLILQPKPESPATGLSVSEKEELAAIRELLKGKATKTELAKIRKKLDQGTYLTVLDYDEYFHLL